MLHFLKYKYILYKLITGGKRDLVRAKCLYCPSALQAERSGQVGDKVGSGGVKWDQEGPKGVKWDQE